jgi:glycogen operon protein
MKRQAWAIEAGLPGPIGVTLQNGGANVAVVSGHATAVYFCLFEVDLEVARFRLPRRSGDVHYGFVKGVKAGQRYGLRADGPWDIKAGHLFDITKLLVDPYARELDRPFRWHPSLSKKGVETSALVPKSVVVEELAPATSLPCGELQIIYEVPVKAITSLHPGIPKDIRGTVAALADPAFIDHVRKLGVDTVELMPVAAWIDERHLPPLGLSNAWGYNPVNFFAPDPRLAPGGIGEIRQTVSALHDAGIRVILDVVFNHTGESDLEGPTLCLRGLDHALYYRQADGVLANDTGTGNTLALDRGPVVQMVMDALRHWVSATGVDGFRYDLATVMGRRPDGFDPDAQLLTAIAQDPLLAPLIHIAEPWDIGPGGYQLGGFPQLWGEWNDRYRDDVRRFWRGDPCTQGALATRIAGSSDIFAGRGRPPSCSINFVAAHDGFTLRDCVTHDHKHNQANGEDNRDGSSHEPCWVAHDPAADVRALLATLFVSRGTLMLTAGDEFGRTQRGNNNAYAQDNELTWLDWQKADESLTQYVSALATFRRMHRRFFKDEFLKGRAGTDDLFPDVEWIASSGTSFDQKDWTDPGLKAFGICLGSGTERLLLCFNRSHEPCMFDLPASLSGTGWELADGFPNPEIGLRKSRATLSPRTVSAFWQDAGKRETSGIPDALTERLADATGIHSAWYEVDGTHHRVSVETRRALLAAMGVPVNSSADALETLRQMTVRPGLPPLHVAYAGRQVSVIYREDGSAGSHRDVLVLTTETGDASEIVKPAGADHVALPPLSAGYYTLSTEDGSSSCRLLVSPQRCWMPELLHGHARVHGLNAHLYALRHRDDPGAGDFETLARYAEAAAAIGGDVVGINPLHHMFLDDRSRVSPYQPSDRRFVDPIYLDIDSVAAEFGLALEPFREETARLRALSHVDYECVWTLKSALLRQAFAKFRSRKAAEFRAFVKDGGEALQQHAAFEAKGGDPEYPMFLQWLCDRQLAMAAARGQKAGLRLGLYRDLALGCAYDGGEALSQPGLFAMTVSLGAPPDPFSRDGQIWNLPPFIPASLRESGLDPFIAILKASMRHAGVLRIDHILGFARQFWVPRDASGAEGAYVSADMEALIAATAIESHRHRCMVVGEDLGTVPDGLRQRLHDAAILSYRMLWFERDRSGFHAASTYPRLSAACITSHDTKTFRGWRESAGDAERHELERALARDGFGTGDLLAETHAFVASSPSAIMLVQADDLTGETEPLNVPGTDRENPNWRRRLSANVEELPRLDTTKRIMAAISRTRPRP